MKMKKVVLTIAGSDSSGGAGIQADLKTFEAFGVYGASAITVVTAQNTTGVTQIEALTPACVLAQIQAVFDDFDVAAVKVGMLFNIDIIKKAESFIKTLEIPVIVDPVFISKAGSPLLEPEAIAALKSLCTYATIITPNTYEAQGLFGYQFEDDASIEEVCSFPVPVLIKNYTLQTAEEEQSIDRLFYKDTKKVFSTPKVDTNNLHGTGCSYSSAIAANIALGNTLEDAITISKEFIYQSLIHAPNIGKGNGPINHKEGGQHMFMISYEMKHIMANHAPIK